MAQDAIQKRLADAVAAGDRRSLEAAVLDNRHHGRPGVNGATKRLLAGLLIARDGKGSPALYETAIDLSESPVQDLRSVSAVLLADLWPEDRDGVFERGLTLAQDDEWEVREWAAGIFGTALDRDFEAEYAAMLELTAHASDRVRRAVVLAAMQAAGAKRPERAAPLLALLEPLLPDAAECVRKNLGPFAIGDKMLGQYPETTLGRLEAWAAREDVWTRWNVAMAATSANAGRHSRRLAPLLERLADDERSPVRSAVRAGLRNLARRAPR